MEKLTYFPGCTLKDTAKDFERSGIAVMAALGYELAEIERWNCCGTVFSLHRGRPDAPGRAGKGSDPRAGVRLG